jgi:hypothetical protein
VPLGGAAPRRITSFSGSIHPWVELPSVVSFEAITRRLSPVRTYTPNVVVYDACTVPFASTPPFTTDLKIYAEPSAPEVNVAVFATVFTVIVGALATSSRPMHVIDHEFTPAVSTSAIVMVDAAETSTPFVVAVELTVLVGEGIFISP